MAALRAVLVSSDSLSPDAVALISATITRIKEISAEGEKGNSTAIHASKPNFELIEALIREKEHLYPGLRFVRALNSDSNSFAAFESVPWVELSRALSNLLDNAAQAAKSLVEVVLCDSGKGIEVRDDGSGVPTYIRNQLFQEGVTAGKVDGTGFGLSGARKLIRDRGGDVVLVATGEQGTAFRIEVGN
jgi:signal transduction histidine kinase